MIFSRLLLHFWRGVLITIYSTLWWWPPAHRICPCVFLHVQSWRFGRGRHSCVFWSELLFHQKSLTFSFPRSTISGRAEATKPSPTAVHRPAEPRRAKPAPPPSNRLSPKPRAERYTPQHPIVRFCGFLLVLTELLALPSLDITYLKVTYLK